MNIHLTVQVPRSTELDAIVERFQNKLEPLLAAFQPELVQLQGRLVRHTSREGVTCRLNLHLPTGQMSSEQSAATAQTAWRGAGDDLLRQLHRHKQRLRTTRPRGRMLVNNNRSRRRRSVAAAPSPARRAELARYFGGHYDDLLVFVQRHLALTEQLGDTAATQLDAEEVLDEVVLAALEAEPGAARQNRGRWLRLLAAAAIHRLEKSYGRRQHGLDIATLETDPRAQDEPDPEVLAGMSEMLEQFAVTLRSLPAPQQRDMILYMIEGFRPEEMAQISHRSRQEVESSLRSAAATLRQQPRLPEPMRQRLRLGWQAQRA
ncbi:MAG: hypothetical protein ACRD2D_07045 [Terriglobales bacterium]